MQGRGGWQTDEDCLGVGCLVMMMFGKVEVPAYGWLSKCAGSISRCISSVSMNTGLHGWL